MPEHCWKPLRLLLLVSLLFAFVTRASAQTTVLSPPPGMTEAQFSALVEAISNAVVEKLRKEGAIAPKPLEPAKSEAVPAGEAEDLASDRAAAFVTRARQALTAFPELWRNLARVPALLDEAASGGRGLVAFLIALAVAIAAALGSEVLLQRVVNGIRLRLDARLAGTTDFWPLIALACLGRARGRGCLARQLWIDRCLVSRL